MEDVWIILVGLLVVLMLAVIFVYNHYDRLRFRLERCYHAAREPLDQWVRLCAEQRGGDDAGYSRCRKLADKTACIRALVESTETGEEKLTVQESLLEFCGSFNFQAEKYDRQLTTTLSGRLAGLLGFCPVGKIDFYPDIR